ncbi:mRNA surveillance protein pelota [Candidatus Woesearchaeota archaeon]|nr:mRNA surveillance protein pelota [Candidatus Woesearchaeota archaeon]|tara:strand:+ start:7875 stop:8894 length:1020 start_codon:yes stop_codon:yes gene_type:complete
MKILKKDLKHGKIVVAVQNLDDLWHLSQVIEKGDMVSGKTTRKIKATEKETEKKTLFLEITVEEVEFKDKNLRISGKTTEEKEDVPKGAYHTISLEISSTAGITKKTWQKYHLKRLELATKKQAETLILVLDREEAIFALLKSKGYEILSQAKGKVAKKGVEIATTNFYKELSDKLEEYDKRYKTEAIILASPAFWKEELMKEIKNNEIKKKVVVAGCSSVGKNAIEEILKRPELNEVLRQQRAAEESKFVENLMMEISKDGLAIYGKKEVEGAIESGNVKTFLITDSFIHENREKSEFLMKNAETVKGEVVIINSENEAGKKLDSLGGIAALLRYKMY